MSTALRRPTNSRAANGTGSPFSAHGARYCFRCRKWRPQAGGTICTRTRQWTCACCKPINLGG